MQTCSSSTFNAALHWLRFAVVRAQIACRHALTTALQAALIAATHAQPLVCMRRLRPVRRDPQQPSCLTSSYIQMSWLDHTSARGAVCVHGLYCCISMPVAEPCASSTVLCGARNTLGTALHHTKRMLSRYGRHKDSNAVPTWARAASHSAACNAHKAAACNNEAATQPKNAHAAPSCSAAQAGRARKPISNARGECGARTAASGSRAAAPAAPPRPRSAATPIRRRRRRRPWPRRRL